MKIKEGDEVRNKFNGLYLGAVKRLYSVNKVKFAEIDMGKDMIRDFKLKILKKI